MAPFHPAIVTLTTSKSCFLSIPENWIKHSIAFQEVPVFLLQYGNNQTAYFSCIGSQLSHEVKITVKFASMLGIKDNEEVLLQQMEESIYQAQKIFLEPLNSDDWEIMELNAKSVESKLLNQIRVVWKGQIFPIWVQNTSFLVRVRKTDPSLQPVLLAEWTEVRIMPKRRHSKSTQSQQLSYREQIRNRYEQYKHLRKRRSITLSESSTVRSDSSIGEPSTSTSGNYTAIVPQNPDVKPFSLLRYVMKSVFTYDESPSQDHDTSSDALTPLFLDFRLRVISYSRGHQNMSKLPLALQATTVFITSNTFRYHCEHETGVTPQCFVARLSKILSPAEEKEKQRTIHEEKTASKDKSRKDKKSKTDEQNDKTASLSYVCVNIIVVESMEEEFDLPLALFLSNNFIAIPLEIKRRLGLEISSCVSCESVEYKPFQFDTVTLRPLENLHVNFTDGLAFTAFTKWVEDANLEDSSLVLCDGTLVKLPVSKKRSCDFIVMLSHSSDNGEGDSTFSSPASLSSSSVGSTDSDRNYALTFCAPTYGYLNKSVLNKLTVKLGKFSPQISKCIWCHSGPGIVDNLYQSIPALGLDALGGIKDLTAKVMPDLERWFKLRPLAFVATGVTSINGAILIHGAKGVGKTTFIKGLCKKLANYPHFIFVFVMECLPLRGKRAETITKKWDIALAESVHRQPALLVLEDLDQLASASSTPEQDASGDEMYFTNIAHAFLSILDKIIENKLKVVVLATSRSLDTLNPLLTQMKGRHVFQTVLEMATPNAAQRIEILQSLLMSKLHISSECIETLDWNTLSYKTEGYVAEDLDLLIDTATHAAWVRLNFAVGSNAKIQLTNDDFNIAVTKYTPSTLHGLKLHSGSGKKWDDIGGLKNVKDAIHQIITWPVKYKYLFKNYSLKPQTNILLYGPPGTGKTMIAGVAATECGLNFISVKGPELLSKYIGASEQGVRDLFVRAASAKPCILFFDEFDALAPRRGHDSTGVTDRVVNQLLTQMDGVEGMEGIYILAATSRPELIDPALVRPGRLDKCLHCPLPNDEERLEIFAALTRKLTLSPDVNLEALIPLTVNFSGADLQALLYSAQVEALHESRDSRSNRYSSSCDAAGDTLSFKDMFYMPSLEQGIQEPTGDEAEKVLQTVESVIKSRSDKDQISRRRRSTISMAIEQKHLLKVTSEMRPSVSDQERLRYEMIFQKFTGGKGSDFSVPTEMDKTQKVTLA